MSIVTAWLIYFDVVIAAGSLGEIGAGIMGDVNDDGSVNIFVLVTVAGNFVNP